MRFIIYAPGGEQPVGVFHSRGTGSAYAFVLNGSRIVRLSEFKTSGTLIPLSAGDFFHFHSHIDEAFNGWWIIAFPGADYLTAY